MPARDENIVWHDAAVSRRDRWQRHNFVGATVWFTGLSGSGKSTIANAVAEALLDIGRPSYLLDGDNLRHGLNNDLGFSDSDRAENIRRVAHVARLMADAGLVVLVPVISPFRADRALARSMHDEAQLPFLEVFVDTPLDLCEERDPKGLYQKARSGELVGMTGIDSPYEHPLSADLVIRPRELAEQAQIVLAALPMPPSGPEGDGGPL